MNLEFNSQIKGLNKNLQEDNNEKKLSRTKLQRIKYLSLGLINLTQVN